MFIAVKIMKQIYFVVNTVLILPRIKKKSYKSHSKWNNFQAHYFLPCCLTSFLEFISWLQAKVPVSVKMKNTGGTEHGGWNEIVQKFEKDTQAKAAIVNIAFD